MRLAWTGAVAALLACAAGASDTARDDKAAAGLARELAGLVPGKPQTCLDTFVTRDASVRSYGDTLVYHGPGQTRWVTRTSGCTGVGGNGDNILVSQSPSTQLCRGDLATTVDRTSHFTDGSCAFGDFTPYSRPRRP